MIQFHGTQCLCDVNVNVNITFCRQLLRITGSFCRCCAATSDGGHTDADFFTRWEIERRHKQLNNCDCSEYPPSCSISKQCREGFLRPVSFIVTTHETNHSHVSGQNVGLFDVGWGWTFRKVLVVQCHPQKFPHREYIYILWWLIDPDRLVPKHFVIILKHLFGCSRSWVKNSFKYFTV